MRTTIAILALILATTAAQAVTGTVSTLELQHITDSELDETIISYGAIAFRSEDMKDLRLGDGVTPGGIGLWNYDALTEPTRYFPHPIHMAGHGIHLNDQTFNALEIGAEGPLFYLRQLGSNVLTIVSGRDETRNAIINIDDMGGAERIRITLLNAEGSTPPVIEYTTSITNQVWVVAEYELDRKSVDKVECIIDVPADLPDRAFRTFRVTTGVYPREARYGVPVRAPSFAIGTGEPITAWPETDLSGHATTQALAEAVAPLATTASVAAVSGRVATVEGWGDHGTEGYLTTAGSWSSHSATQTVNMLSNHIINVAGIFGSSNSSLMLMTANVATPPGLDIQIKGGNVGQSYGDAGAVILGGATNNAGHIAPVRVLGQLEATNIAAAANRPLSIVGGVVQGAGNTSMPLRLGGGPSSSGSTPGSIEFLTGVNAGGNSMSNLTAVHAESVTATNFGHPDKPNAIHISSTGGVGIGTNAPAAGLEVSGGFVTARGPSGSGVLIADRVGGRAVALMAASSASIFAYDMAGAFGILAQPKASLTNSPGSAGNYAMYIGTTQNVGIDTTAPAERLHVNGNAIVNGFLTVSNRINLGSTGSWLHSDGTNLFFSTSVGAGVTNQITSN